MAISKLFYQLCVAPFTGTTPDNYIACCSRNYGASSSWISRPTSGKTLFSSFALDGSERRIGLWCATSHYPKAYKNNTGYKTKLQFHAIDLTQDILDDTEIDFTTLDGQNAFIAKYGSLGVSMIASEGTWSALNVTVNGVSEGGTTPYYAFTPSKTETTPKVFYFTDDDIKAMYGDEYVITPVPTPTTYTLTQNLTQATSNTSETTFDENAEIDYTVTANSGYKFTTVPTVNGVEMTKTSETEYTTHIVFNEDKIVNANATLYKDVTTQLNNCTANPEITSVEIGVGATTVITANNGYYFKDDIPYCSYTDHNGNSLKSIGVKIDDYNYTVTIPTTAENLIVIKGNAVVETEYKDRYGYLNIFTPTAEQMKNILSGRYKTITGDYGVTYIDLGDYIATLIRLFCNVPSSDEQNVKLGTYDTGVKCSVSLADVVTVNCGSVEVVESFHNRLDYDETEIEIFLPFIGNETLETKKVMGATIELNYKVNVITGDCVAIITKGENVLYMFDGNLSYELPYLATGQTGVINKLKPNNKYLYDFTPVLYIYTPRVYGNDGIFGNVDNIVDSVENFKGYTVFSETWLNVNAYTSEIEEIKNILESGVIV